MKQPKVHAVCLNKATKPSYLFIYHIYTAVHLLTVTLHSAQDRQQT